MKNLQNYITSELNYPNINKGVTRFYSFLKSVIFKSNIVMIGGVSGIGKSTLIRNIAETISESEYEPVIFFNCDNDIDTNYYYIYKIIIYKNATNAINNIYLNEKHPISSLIELKTKISEQIQNLDYNVNTVVIDDVDLILRQCNQTQILKFYKFINGFTKKGIRFILTQTLDDELLTRKGNRMPEVNDLNFYHFNEKYIDTVILLNRLSYYGFAMDTEGLDTNLLLDISVNINSDKYNFSDTLQLRMDNMYTYN